MVVRVGRSGVAFRMKLVGQGLEKQEAVFSRLAFPREDDSVLELKDRSMEMRMVLDFQKSWGQCTLEARLLR